VSACECGNRRNNNASACPRCIFLDGRSAKQMDVIMLLREVPQGLSLVEMCRELLGMMGHNERTSMLRTMQGLEAQGRVRRRWEETDKHVIHAQSWGVTGRIAFGASGRWVYELVESREHWRAA
jgi:hypothetical protein